MNNTTHTTLTPPLDTEQNRNTPLHQNQTSAPPQMPKPNFLPQNSPHTLKPEIAASFTSSLTSPQDCKQLATAQNTPPQTQKFPSPNHLSQKTAPSPQEDIQRRLARHKQHMREYEIGDDGYYLSRQYQEDKQILYDLEQSLKKLTSP